VNLKAAAAAVGVGGDRSANVCSGTEDTEAELCKVRLVEIAVTMMRNGQLHGMAADE